MKLFQRYYKVVGVDISAEAVAYARRKVSGPVLLGNPLDALTGIGSTLDAVLLPIFWNIWKRSRHGRDRNKRQKGVDWRVTTKDARIKLKRLYPLIKN